MNPPPFPPIPPDLPGDPQYSGPPDLPGAPSGPPAVPSAAPVLGDPPPFPNPPEGVSAVWRCPLRVGLLFPHQCNKTSSVGCTDCGNGQINDPYRSRPRYGYDDYESYDSNYYGYGGYGLFSHRPHRSYNDFTEGDGENLVKPNQEFEKDMSGS